MPLRCRHAQPRPARRHGGRARFLRGGDRCGAISRGVGPCRPRALRESDLYDAPTAIAEPASFDLVYTSWGVTCWLPDIRRWAEIVAQFLKPGGRFYYADRHPASYVFDDDARLADGKPGYFAPYFGRQPLVLVEHKDYADPTAHLANATNVEWLHPLSDIWVA
jgi:SAM-dependent methyltransferase